MHEEEGEIVVIIACGFINNVKEERVNIISDQFQIPVKYIGASKGVADLQVFNKYEFVD